MLYCAHFSLTYISDPNFLPPSIYVAGKASPLYQDRVLPMYIFRALMGTHLVQSIATHAPNGLNTPYEVVLVGLVFFSMLGAVITTAATINQVTNNELLARWTSLLVVYMSYFNLTPHWGLNYTLPYDAPALFFFCLETYLVVAHRWWLYYLVFPIAVLNRETICFMTVFFLVWELVRLGSPSVAKAMRLLPHLLAQVAIWLGVKLALAHKFVHHETKDAFLMVKFSYNVHELFKPWQWPVIFSACGFLWPILWLGRRWIQDRQMTWACGIVIGLWIASMLVIGQVTELRDFSELTAFAVPLLALILYHRFGPLVKCATDRK